MLQGYQVRLFEATGVLVFPITIHNSFAHGFNIKGSLYKPNTISYDKIRPKNIDCTLDCLQIIIKFDCRRLKFGDKKHLKDAEIWYKKTHRNMFT